ncbi:alpha/beta fold hydrolase [Mycobacterium sp.]|uniref:alpha/beta fold hydrolase n=1 Tax=Mycobacterium sp. TaxID=1785 RepID=UPI002B7AA29C|nr:alpha/beta fold hydrolase [Mycobacterium sp.]HTQ22309.1 alpha/beta fold hydrolase [Mycobacterium sp.]
MSIAPSTASAIASVDALNGPPGFVNLHPDGSINYQLNRWLSAMTPQALTDVAEVAVGISNYDQFIGEFLALADKLLAQGRRRDAAFCLRAADFFLPVGDERKTPTQTRFLELVREVYGIGPGQYDAVPYAGGVLPALRLGRPDRGSVLITGGFDGYLEDRFAMMLAITHAGYQVIAFDGPGQGAALEDSGMIFTTEWHRAVGAVLDHFGLHQAALIGSSLGGCLAIRRRGRTADHQGRGLRRMHRPARMQPADAPTGGPCASRAAIWAWKSSPPAGRQPRPIWERIALVSLD